MRATKCSWLVVTGFVSMAWLLPGSRSSFAQTIGQPVVRPAVAARESSGDLGTLSLQRQVPFWREGDPVRVKGDLQGQGLLLPQLQPVAKRPDALADQSQLSLLNTMTGTARPLPPPIIGVNVPGIPATGVLPPDTVGAVGPNHYIQMVNSAFAVYDKTGRLLVPPAEINSLWTAFGGPCESDNDGDPVVRYDHLADRWLLSQFAINQHMQCVAISKTSDPLSGGWFLYAFETRDSNGNGVTPDYPKVGVWPDGYYMSTQRGFPNGGMDVWVFERTKMLAGQPARQVQFSVGSPSIVLQPSDLNGTAPPPGTPNFFLRQMDGQRFGGSDRVEIFGLSVDWAQPNASTFSLVAALPVTAFDSLLCQPSLGGPCVPQPNTTVKLHTLSVWPMYRAQYRNFGAHEVLLLNHTVDASGTDQAGIRWYEFRRKPGGTWTVFQEGTHAPDNVHRWMGSIAMNAAGEILLGYSVANAQTAPGIRVAMRRPSDTLGSVGNETVVATGGGSQTHVAARWGDYASMDVDPVRPCTFWLTSLFYERTSSAGWSTRIAEIQSPDRAPNCNPLIPDLKGLSLPQARARLQALGLAVGTLTTAPDMTGPGTLTVPVVIEQSVAPLAETAPGTTVNLTLRRLRQPQ